MSSTAPFERVAPTWEVGGAAPERPTSPDPSRQAARIAIVVGAGVTLAAVMAVVGVIVAGFALGLPMGSGIGERTPRPQSAADLARGYELTAGELRLDLRDVAFPRGTTRTSVEVGYGEATIVVPRDVDVVVDGHVDAGNLSAFGREDDGFGVDATRAAAGERDAPTLVVDAHVGFGQLRIVRET